MLFVFFKPMFRVQNLTGKTCAFHKVQCIFFYFCYPIFDLVILAFLELFSFSLIKTWCSLSSFKSLLFIQPISCKWPFSFSPCSGWSAGQTSPEVCIQLPPWGIIAIRHSEEDENTLEKRKAETVTMVLSSSDILDLQNSLLSVWNDRWLTKLTVNKQQKTGWMCDSLCGSEGSWRVFHYPTCLLWQQHHWGV